MITYLMLYIHSTEMYTGRSGFDEVRSNYVYNTFWTHIAALQKFMLMFIIFQHLYAL